MNVSRSVGSAAGAVAALAVPGIAAILTGRVLLFASLGPTAVMQASAPRQPSSRPYSVIVSHSIGVVCAFSAVLAFGLASDPSVFVVGQLSTPRVLAGLSAVGAATILEFWTGATHPPAASTTLLISLGSFRPTLPDAISVLVGVGMIALSGEAVRRLSIRFNHR